MLTVIRKSIAAITCVKFACRARAGFTENRHRRIEEEDVPEARMSVVTVFQGNAIVKFIPLC